MEFDSISISGCSSWHADEEQPKQWENIRRTKSQNSVHCMCIYVVFYRLLKDLNIASSNDFTSFCSRLPEPEFVEAPGAYRMYQPIVSRHTRKLILIK